MAVSFCGLTVSSPQVVARGQQASFNAPLQAFSITGADPSEDAGLTYTIPPGADLRFVSGDPASGKKSIVFVHAVLQSCVTFTDSYSLEGTFTGIVFINVTLVGAFGDVSKQSAAVSVV